MKSLIGDKRFYKSFFLIAVPIIIQQLVINSASIVDNLMVGQLGSESVQAMGVIFPVIFITSFLMYSTSHGSGIYISQFKGSGEKDKLETAIGVKIKLLTIVSIIAATILYFVAPAVTRIFTDNSIVQQNAIDYLRIYAFAIIPIYMSYSMSSTYVQLGLPSKSLPVAVVGVGLNIALNSLFIFGNSTFGIPKMGIGGAALGTLISQTITLLIFIFIVNKKMYTNNIFKIPFRKTNGLLKKIILVSLPLVFNEMVWAFGMSTRTAIWAGYGDNALGALAIQTNVQQFVNISFAGMSAATAYIIGTTLGTGNKEKAKEIAWKLFGTSIMLGLAMGGILFIIKDVIIGVYDISPEIASLASELLSISSMFFFVWMGTATLFFILRAGGKTKQLFIMDGITIWGMVVPTAYILLHYTNVSFATNMFWVYTLDLSKMIIALLFVLSYKWLIVLTNKKSEKQEESEPQHIA